MKKISSHAGIRILILPAFLFIFLLSNSCSNMNSPSNSKTSTNTTITQGANEVYIQGKAFSPFTLTVTSGTAVKWTNKDSVNHNITSDNATYTSGNIATNGVYSYTFKVAGTFTYHDNLYPAMKGTIIVTLYLTPTGY